MAIIIKGQRKLKNEKEQKIKPTPAKQEVKPIPAKPQPVKKVEPIRKETPKDINNDYRFDPNKTYLVVGGKVKEISSKSKYLLDMLIIEKED